MADTTNPPILCNPISLADFLKFCCTGKLPSNVQQSLSAASQDPMLRAILCAAEILGALEPLSATRPGVCDPVVVIDKQIVVPPATVKDGVLVPSEVRAICYCAPLNRALVVDESRVTAGNLTGASQPINQPLYKRVNLGTFGEWCLPFEPLVQPGQFMNVEHIIVPPGGGYCVYVQNFDPESEAVYHLHSRMWASC